MRQATARPRLAGQAIAKSSGVVIGRVQKVSRQALQPVESEILEQDIEQELQRLRTAVLQASAGIQAEIQALRDEKSPDDVVLILEVHHMMLHDPELIGAAEMLIREQLINVEWALKKSLDRIGDSFDQIKDAYLRSRKADIEHVGQRILSKLAAEPAAEGGLQPLMLAVDFSPADIVEMWRKGVQGFISVQGGADSHAMIVARGVGLTGLAGVQGLFDHIEDGDTLIIDAEQGCWVLHPKAEEQNNYLDFQRSLAVVQQGLRSYVNQPSTSQSGYTMPLMANLEFADEAEVANHVGADGVGLFRSEFLFMQGSSLPDEEQQYLQYRQVVRNMAGKPVTFRLLDVGADKISTATELVGLADSENPALGLRGVRLLLHKPALMHTQLRAMVRAAEHGAIAILIPMVTSVSEVVAVRDALHSIKAELGTDADIALGCMIEVPAAALIAADLAAVSDFLSIGSNDLMQYCLAVDRADEHVGHLYDAEHPAIKILIRMIAEAAQQQGVPVSLCGELAANPAWTQFFLDMKMTSLSMSAHCVLAVRKQLQALA